MAMHTHIKMCELLDTEGECGGMGECQNTAICLSVLSIVNLTVLLNIHLQKAASDIFSKIISNKEVFKEGDMWQHVESEAQSRWGSWAACSAFPLTFPGIN